MNAKLARELARDARAKFDNRLAEGWATGTRSERMAIKRLRTEAVAASTHAEEITLGEYADRLCEDYLNPPRGDNRRTGGAQ